MKLRFLGFGILTSFVSLPATNSAEPNSQRNATRADVLRYLGRISNSRTISGQHNREPNSDPSKWFRVVYDITGKYAGLWGGDFLYLPDEVRNRQAMVNEAITQWNAGSLVSLTWHVCPPTGGETCNWDAGGIKSHLNNHLWNDLVRSGGHLNTLWKTRLDTIVPYLRQLENAGVVAIWRPIHEMNEGWSWWGGRPGSNGSRKLYQLTHEYLTQVRGLRSLVWTWNVKDVEMQSIGAYWPGNEYVDVASLDTWVNRYPTDSDYQRILAVAGGKPIALAEVGSVPTPELLDRQPKWVWFMVWAEYLKDPAYNSDKTVKDTYYTPRVLSRGGEVGSEALRVEDCGGICDRRDDCTHFSWTNYNNGTCWLKGYGVNLGAVEKYDAGAVCAWVKN